MTSSSSTLLRLQVAFFLLLFSMIYWSPEAPGKLHSAATLLLCVGGAIAATASCRARGRPARGQDVR